MASAAVKTAGKPGNEVKKEKTPPTKNEEDRKSAENELNNKNQPPKEPENRAQVRENKFQKDNDNKLQNRRGGRGMSHRGGRGGGPNRNEHQFQNDDGQFQGFPQFHGDFMGETNDGPKEQKKFTGRCRLFVGNITSDTTEEQFKEMFAPYGEVSEVFVNAARGFGFIRLDYRINAEKAKIELDGQMRNNRVLRVRFATHGAALKVTNLSPFISNELLEQAFSQFGEVERAVVCVDDRGRSYGEGIVEFARKPGAQAALKRINEGVFLLSTYPRPIHVELVEQRDEDDGLTEKFVQRNEGFRKDREKEPRFAPPGSFEFEFGLKHRHIDEMEKERIERVKAEMEIERQRLAEEMETAVFDFQAEQIRQDLMRQQEELKRLDELKNEHMRRRQEMDLRRREQLQRNDNIMQQEDDRRREMMMRASNAMNRDRGDGGMNQLPPGPRGHGGRPDDMMIRGAINDRDMVGSGQRGPGTPPMPPPPVPPGMNMEQGGRQNAIYGGMSGNMGGSSPGGPDQSPIPSIKSEQMRPPQGPPPGGRFSGPPGQGNYPQSPVSQLGGPQGGSAYNKMSGGPGAGPMGPGGSSSNNQSMRGNERGREGPVRRDDYGDPKRMRRF